MRNLVFILFFTPSILFGQKSEQKTIQLKEYVLEQKIIILFENKSYKILTSRTTFDTFYKEKINSSDWNNLNTELYGNGGQNNDTLNFHAYSKNKSLERQMLYITRTFIDNSNCVIIDKKTNKKEYLVTVKPYSNIGTAGTAYYIENNLLFEIYEIVF